MGAPMDITMEKAGGAILFLIALVLSISVHEFGHAWAANRLGDSLPRAQGRLTLNPIRHIDPIGTLLFPLIMYLNPTFTLLGWGRPVQTNPSNYTRSMSRTTGSMLVSIAGPGMNLLLAAIVSVLIIVGAKTGLLNVETADSLIGHLVRLNLSLMFFNLLPIPPLDGGAVLEWVLPRSMQGVVDFLARWGFLILLGLLFTGMLGYLMRPAGIAAQAWVDALRSVAGLDGVAAL